MLWHNPSRRSCSVLHCGPDKKKQLQRRYEDRQKVYNKEESARSIVDSVVALTAAVNDGSLDSDRCRSFQWITLICSGSLIFQDRDRRLGMRLTGG